MRMLHVSVGGLREEGLTRETRRRTLGGVFGFQRCTPLPSGSRKRICLDRFGALPTLSHDPDARKAIPASVKLRWARCHQGERKEKRDSRRGVQTYRSQRRHLLRPLCRQRYCNPPRPPARCRCCSPTRTCPPSSRYRQRLRYTGRKTKYDTGSLHGMGCEPLR